VLRALSRVELTRPESFTDVDLADLAELALHAARSRHPGTRFEFRCETGDLTMTGWADGLRMVIDNLLDNAAVHGTGGAVILGIPGPSQEPDSIMMTVDDEGPGIPPDLRPRIFERFSKSSTSRGFGLGLTIVAQVVALHAGTVEASSPPSGRGARFTVRLPSQGFPKVPS
jgi:two-component system sensor histidine kinase PrrB